MQKKTEIEENVLVCDSTFGLDANQGCIKPCVWEKIVLVHPTKPFRFGYTGVVEKLRRDHGNERNPLVQLHVSPWLQFYWSSRLTQLK